MAKQSSVNLDITNNPDGFDISGGVISRKLTVTGGDVEISGTGSATITFPTTSTTVAGLSIAQTFTALQTFSSGISANGITGTILTPSQTNITSVGVLNGLSVNNGLSVTGGASITGGATVYGDIEVYNGGFIRSGGLSVTGGINASNGLDVTGGATFGGTVNMTTNIIRDLEMRDYYESLATPTFSSGVLTCDLNASQVFNHTLSASITSIVLQNVPPKANTSIGFTLVIKQGATGGLTATFTGISGATALFPGGTAPTMSSAANKTDIVSYISYDNGSNWFGFVGGQAF